MARKSSGGKFKRSLNLIEAVFFGLGAIIGAGIYTIIGESAKTAGNMLWLSFLIAAVVAIASSVSYAEFSSRFPDAGGSFEYIRQSFGDVGAYFAGIFMTLTGVVSSAAIAISFADYLSRLIAIPQLYAIIGIIILMGVVNIAGIQKSSTTNSIATVITLGGLLFLIISSLDDWGSIDYFKMAPAGLNGVLTGGALAFFSYVGFEEVVKLAEETKNPRINIPRSILISGFLVLVIYVLVSVSAVSSIDYEKLAGTDGPLVAVMNKNVGKIGVSIIAIVALFATSNSILTNILSTSRLCYAMAGKSEIDWLRKLTFIPRKLSVPVYSVLLIVVLSVAFALIKDLTVVAAVSNFFILLVFLMVNIALIVWRYKNKEAGKPRFKAPVNIGSFPVIAALAVILVLILLGYNIHNLIQFGFGGN